MLASVTLYYQNFRLQTRDGAYYAFSSDLREFFDIQYDLRGRAVELIVSDFVPDSAKFVRLVMDGEVRVAINGKRWIKHIPSAVKLLASRLTEVKSWQALYVQCYVYDIRNRRRRDVAEGAK